MPLEGNLSAILPPSADPLPPYLADHSWATAFERDILARACRDDFWLFANFVYGIRRDPRGKKWLDPVVHYPLCKWFEEQARGWLARRAAGTGERTYLAVIVPRAVGKSTLLTEAGMLWLHLQDPNLSVYIGNEKRENAIDFLGNISAQLDGTNHYSWFKWLYGSWAAETRGKWRQDYITHAARKGARKEASFGIWGIEGGLTSKHPDVLCLDDLVSYEGLQGDSNWFDTMYSHMAALIPVVESDGLTLLIGTRYRDDDPFGRSFAPESDGIASVSGMQSPEYKPTPGGLWHVYFLSGKDATGAPTCPKTWSLKSMESYRKRDPVKFAAQVLNDPKQSPYRPLTEEWFDKNALCPPETVPTKLRVTFHFDSALKDEKRQHRGDYNALVALGHDIAPTGKVWFLGAWRDRTWSVEDFRLILLARLREKIAAGHLVKLFTDEDNGGGHWGAWPMLVKSWFREGGIRPIPAIHILKRYGGANVRKTNRHRVAAGYILNGKVKFPTNAPGLEFAREELCNIGTSTNDDVVDAFSDGFDEEIYRVLRTLAPTTSPARLDRPWDEILAGKEHYKGKFAKYGILPRESDPRPPIG